MATSLRRSSRNSSSSIAVISRSSSQTSPADGSINRLMHRTSVDFPHPESPMTTNSSPRRTSNDTSASASTESCISWIASLVVPVCARASAPSSLPPKTL